MRTIVVVGRDETVAMLSVPVRRLQPRDDPSRLMLGGANGRGAPPFRPSASPEVAQAAQPPAGGRTAVASFVQSQIGDVLGEPFREPGEGS